jgi:TonB family protein
MDQWYVRRIQEIVYSNWGDPFQAQAKPQGDLRVMVSFVIHRDGTVTEVEIEKRSGHAAFDRAGLRAVENSRMPELPRGYPGDAVRIHYQFYLD